jgi:aspartate 4-decarboxylase
VTIEDTPTAGEPSRARQRQLAHLSPFELKDHLISLADANLKRSTAVMLNAGRGNPNWVATTPREAFFLLGQFGLEESRRTWAEWDDLGGMPASAGIAARLDRFLDIHDGGDGASLLRRSVRYATDHLGLGADEFVFELTDSVIGDNYPAPVRMLRCVETVVQAYLVQELCGGKPVAGGDFDLFAVEGGTAAMCYVFDSLVISHVLSPGDRVALMVPIFAPYLEIPRLTRYRFDVVAIRATKCNENGFHTWQFEPGELDQLADPSVRALFVINPSNPPSVMLSPDASQQIADILARENPGLVVVTDDVYATFVEGFESLISIAPRNTIGVYSFSKYFGATGWRLGVIALHPDNVIDEAIAALAPDDQLALQERYATITLEPGGLRFIDRLVADSRDVALNHTAGLSLPQQAQMALFSLFALTDDQQSYKQNTRAIIARRLHALVEGLGIDLPRDPLAAHYYVELDLLAWAERHWGADFCRWMQETFEPIDPIIRLAAEHSVVLLNGGGFDGPQWSVRISLANLPFHAYEQIGNCLWTVGQSYKAEYDLTLAESPAR